MGRLQCTQRRAPRHRKAFLVAGLVGLVLSPSLAFVDEHRARVELQTVRPFALVEGLSGGREGPAADGRNRGPAGAVLEPGYVFGKTPAGDGILYHIRNTGSVPARRIRHHHRLLMVRADGTVSPIPQEERPDGNHILLPGQASVFDVTVPPGKVFSPNALPGETVRVQILVTYAGQDADPREYFYRTVLKCRRFKTPADMKEAGPGTVTVQSSDEGVVADLDALMQTIPDPE